MRKKQNTISYTLLIFTLLGCSNGTFTGSSDRRQGANRSGDIDVPNGSTPVNQVIGQESDFVTPGDIPVVPSETLQSDAVTRSPVNSAPEQGPVATNPPLPTPPPATVPSPGTGPGPGPSPKPQTPEEIKKACETSANLFRETNQILVYKRPSQTCQFGLNGNLERRDAFVQAAGVTAQKLTLPEGTVCSIGIKTTGANTTLRYDDFISLTLNTHVLFFSNETFLPYLVQTNGIYQWDFARLRGRAITNFGAPGYCIAKTGSCLFPNHDTSGPISIDLTPADLAPIAATLVNQSSAALNLNVTGDNNDTDCIHTDIELATRIIYLPK
jgi:hypothetical protein